MKIAFFTDMYNPYVAGVVTFIDVLAEQYIKEGHEVVIFTHKGATNPLEKKGVRVITFSKLPAVVYPDMNITFPNILTFVKTIRKEAPDIIHSNTPGPLSELALQVGRILHIPTVITFHGLMDEYYKYFSLPHPSWMPFPQISKYDNLKKKLIRMLIRKHFNKFNVVTASTPLTKKLLQQGGINCQLVRIGLDVNTFYQKKNYKKTNKILSVSRLGFEKKIDIILRAVHELQDPKLRLTIVGDGPAKSMLKKLAKELALADQVTFAGKVERKTLQEYFNAHDFFANASDTETFGYVTAEAMAGGLPIVGVKAQGTGDLVQEGMNGFLAQPNNIRSFANTIEKMLEVQDYSSMGAASYRMAQEYSPENSAKEHLAIYQKAILQFGKSK